MYPGFRVEEPKHSKVELKMGGGWLFVFFITLAASLKFGDAVSAGNVAAKGCGGFVKSQKNIDFSTIEIVMETQTQNGNFAIFKPFNVSSIHFDKKKIGLHEQGVVANYIPKFQVPTMSLEVA